MLVLARALKESIVIVTPTLVVPPSAADVTVSGWTIEVTPVEIRTSGKFVRLSLSADDSIRFYRKELENRQPNVVDYAQFVRDRRAKKAAEQTS